MCVTVCISVILFVVLSRLIILSLFVCLQAFSHRQTTLQCHHHHHGLLPAHVLMPDPPPHVGTVG